MNKLELLCPAGNFDSLKMAVYNGADAVYFGLDYFNARGNIENFTKENLEQAVHFCHLFNVKVCLTLNILLKDEEFANMEDYVRFALKCGVDAFIVQDIGVAYYLRNKFPNIELHASTQMGIQNLEAVKFLEKLGFKRVVLARETPLSEIKRIKDNCDIEIEYFVQGALCVAFSGNCYLCSHLADSSGNRGKCKQFCRLPYSMKKEDVEAQGYLLSTKDFCMLPKLKELVDCGVTSFKIEGRARRPYYVGQTTRVYRKVLDNNYNFSNSDINDLKQAFNRGNFIKGYFENEKIIYSHAQNHIGLPIGEVISVKVGKKFNEVLLKSNHQLKRGDVIKFFVDKKEAGTLSIFDVKVLQDDRYLVTTTNSVPPKAKVHLIVDEEKEEAILNTKKKIEVDIKLQTMIGEHVHVTAKHQEIEVSYDSDFIVEKAKTSPISTEDCAKQFAKMGDFFQLNEFDAKLEDVFITKGQLNELRRRILDLLDAAIIEKYNKDNKIIEKSLYNEKQVLLTSKPLNDQSQKLIMFDDFDKIENIYNSEDIFVYSCYDFSIENFERLYEKHKKKRIYISFPILTNKNEIEIYKQILAKCANWGVYANNYYAFSLTDKEKTIVGANMNICNSYSIKFYSEIGYKNVVISNEDFAATNLQNSGINLYCFENFYPEYMYFRHCPLKEHFGSSCQRCNYKNDIKVKLNNNEFILKRIKTQLCQFVLKSVKEKRRYVANDIKKAIEI